MKGLQVDVEQVQVETRSMSCENMDIYFFI
jgi:hypothetical protein